MIVGILFSPVFAEARILNLRGTATLNYRFSQSDSGGGGSKVESFGQRYNLGMGGKIFRFGQYSLSGSWINDRAKSESRRQGALTDKQERELTIQEFRIFSSLFPKSSPLSLSAQRIIRENEFEVTSSKDVIDVVSATWALNMRRVPRTIFTYTRSGRVHLIPRKSLKNSASRREDTSCISGPDKAKLPAHLGSVTLTWSLVTHTR